jgi:hypothetical protein
MDLGMAVMAASDAIVSAGGFDLLILEFAVLEALILKTGLEKPAATAAAAAEIVGAVGLHVDEIFLADHRFYNETQVLGNRITVALADDLAGILNREFDFQVLVPVGIDFEFSFTNPFGIIFVNAFNFKVVLEVEFFQSGPD